MTNMFKTLASAAVTSLLASTGAAQNTARCRITGRGFANSRSAEVGVAVAAQASAYICDPDATSSEANAISTATAIATATATAIASVFGECTAQGNGSFRFNGRSLAQAEAFAIATSFAEALVTANSCGFCNIAADFIADSFENIFISAAAEAEAALSGDAAGGSIEASVDILSETIISASATAYAQVIVAAAVDVDGGCEGSIIGVVGGMSDTCSVDVSADDDTLVENADTELIIDLVAEACDADEEVIIEVDVAVTATATAMARAIAKITASCEIQGDTTACVLGEADIETAAQAVASSFAESILQARSTCEPPRCEVSAQLLTQVTVPILAEATASAVFAQCASSGDTFSTTVLDEEIETIIAEALASVYALVSVVGGVCDLSSEAISQVTIPG